MIYLQSQNLKWLKIIIGIRIKCIMPGIAYQSQSLEQKMSTSRSVASCNTEIPALWSPYLVSPVQYWSFLATSCRGLTKKHGPPISGETIWTEAMWDTSKYFGIKLSLVNYSVSLKFQGTLGAFQVSVFDVFMIVSSAGPLRGMFHSQINHLRSARWALPPRYSAKPLAWYHATGTCEDEQWANRCPKSPGFTTWPSLLLHYFFLCSVSNHSYHTICILST